jgi:hypothetical protein
MVAVATPERSASQIDSIISESIRLVAAIHGHASTLDIVSRLFVTRKVGHITDRPLAHSALGCVSLLPSSGDY